MKTITQKPNAYAFKGSKSKPCNVKNTCVVNGGIIELKGGKHTLKGVYGTGDIKGGGTYRVLMASTPGTELVWDLRGVKHPRQTNGGEAAFRAMGRAKKAVIYGVDFECRKWKDSKGKIDFWKGWSAIRDIDHCEFRGGSAVGPWDVGEQENAGKPQTVKTLIVDGMGLTHLPRISRPKSAKTKGRSGVQKIVFRKCPKLKAVYDKKDPMKLIRVEPVKDNKGKPVYWPDATWTPDER